MTAARDSAICAALLILFFAGLMLIGFPLRFDGKMPWDLMSDAPTNLASSAAALAMPHLLGGM